LKSCATAAKMKLVQETTTSERNENGWPFARFWRGKPSPEKPAKREIPRRYARMRQAGSSK
jgi:hypothetical protein